MIFSNYDENKNSCEKIHISERLHNDNTIKKIYAKSKSTLLFLFFWSLCRTNK